MIELAVGAVLAWFLPWYLRRYTPLIWPVVDLFNAMGNLVLKPFGITRTGYLLLATVQLSPDGTRLVSGDEEGIVKVWDVRRRQEPLTSSLKGVTGTILSIMKLTIENKTVATSPK